MGIRPTNTASMIPAQPGPCNVPEMSWPPFSKILVYVIHEAADDGPGETYSAWRLPGAELMIFTEQDKERHTRRKK